MFNSTALTFGHICATPLNLLIPPLVMWAIVLILVFTLFVALVVSAFYLIRKRPLRPLWKKEGRILLGGFVLVLVIGVGFVIYEHINPYSCSGTFGSPSGHCC